MRLTKEVLVTWYLLLAWQPFWGAFRYDYMIRRDGPRNQTTSARKTPPPGTVVVAYLRHSVLRCLARRRYFSLLLMFLHLKSVSSFVLMFLGLYSHPPWRERCGAWQEPSLLPTLRCFFKVPQGLPSSYYRICTFHLLPCTSFPTCTFLWTYLICYRFFSFFNPFITAKTTLSFFVLS